MTHSLFRPALFFTALSAFLLFASPQNAAAAALTNGGFETGSFSPWVVSEVSYTTNPAPAFVSGASFTNAMGVATNVTPAEGSYQAVLNAPTSGTTSAPDLETFLGLASGALDPLTSGISVFDGGSAIKQTFDVRDGSVISFQWNFLPNGTNFSPEQNDSGFFTLHAAAVTNSTNYTVLSTTISSGGNPTGYQPYTTGPLTAGSYLLGFSAFDQQQQVTGWFDAQQPTLLIDAVTAYVPNLYVGSNSSGVTTNFTSGTNYYENTYVGYSSTDSNNTLNVSNAATVLTNYTDLHVGYQGSSNTMKVANGGTVAVASNSHIGFSNTSSNNSVLVTGSNSLWTNSRELSVGYAGSGNSLVVADGGTVANSYGYIGLVGTSSNNSVLVTGPGSLWSNSWDLYVGQAGSDNSLTVADGGTVANRAGFIGGFSTSANNSVLVTGAGSLWTNGTDLLVGYQVSSSSLTISNGGIVANTDGYIGFSASSSNNSVLVSGTSSLWANGNALFVGNSGSGNSLTISNGGKVAAAENSYIGYYFAASNNSALVTGAGSTWTNSGELYVGVFGSDNLMVISNGGQVAASAGFVGGGPGSSNNSVLVTGISSTLTSSGRLDVGSGGSGNTMTISEGGTVAGVEGFIGASFGSSNNSALVTGAGSVWNNSGELSVGMRGAGNTLTVADGGTVSATNIVIGRVAGSSGTLNIGRFGTNDAAGTISAPSIAFGAGTGTINFNQSNSTTLSAVISGAGSLNQLGSGTTILSASNTYTGATTVAAGQLVVDGSIANSAVTVQNGGTLGGAGAVGSLTILDGATLSPGNSPGTLNVAGNVTWNGGGNYNWQVLGTTNTPGFAAGATWDLITATGALDLTSLSSANKFNLNLWSLSAVAPDAPGNALNFNSGQNYTWTILTAATGITGFAADKFNINLGATNGTAGFANGLNGGTFSLLTAGNDLNLIFTAGGAAVPEPGTWAAAALLAGGAAFMRWRKRSKVS